MGHDFQNMNQIAIGYLELAIDALNLKGGEQGITGEAPGNTHA